MQNKHSHLTALYLKQRVGVWGGGAGSSIHVINAAVSYGQIYTSGIADETLLIHNK